MRTVRYAIAALVVAMLAGACGTLEGSLGGSTTANEWSLIGVTPDERHLLVSTFFGGVASDCTRWEGWEISETDEQVEIKALIWEQRMPSGCTDDGVVETIEITLDAPLGQRDLVGCGNDGCRRGDYPNWIWAGVIDAVANADGVFAAVGGAITGLDADGDILWQAEDGPARLVSVEEGVVLVTAGIGAAALDPITGAELWATPGWMTAASADALLMCVGDAESVAAVDATTGNERWSADVPCGDGGSFADTVVLVAPDWDVDGGSELIVLDSATGSLLSRAPFDDGLDDRVTGFDGFAASDEYLAAGGQQAQLIVLSPDGDEMVRGPMGLGTPLGFVDDALIVAKQSTVQAIDPASGAALWRSADFGQTEISISNDTLWALDGAVGSVSRLDPATGSTMWTAGVGITPGFAVATADGVAYVATALAVLAFDSETGEELWWKRIPYRSPFAR